MNKSEYAKASTEVRECIAQAIRDACIGENCINLSAEYEDLSWRRKGGEWTIFLGGTEYHSLSLENNVRVLNLLPLLLKAREDRAYKIAAQAKDAVRLFRESRGFK